MSARQTIAGLLEQWRCLTGGETQAIQTGAWADLKKIQADKADLQPQLTAAMDEWAAENRGLPAAGAGDHPFRAEVNQLIALEASNGALLADQMRKRREALASLEQAGRRLRRVRGSYASRPEANWQSYS